MNWYLAKIVFRIICGEGNHTAQFDEQLRLIKASSKNEALVKAQSTGKNEEDNFLNADNKLVQWKFINVSELYKLTELADGAEMYSRIEERDDGDNYISIIHKKAQNLQFGNTHELLQLV